MKREEKQHIGRMPNHARTQDLRCHHKDAEWKTERSDTKGLIKPMTTAANRLSVRAESRGNLAHRVAGRWIVESASEQCCFVNLKSFMLSSDERLFYLSSSGFLRWWISFCFLRSLNLILRGSGGVGLVHCFNSTHSITMLAYPTRLIRITAHSCPARTESRAV